MRLVEGRLRLMTNRALDEHPHAEEEQEDLARRLGLKDAAAFRVELQCHTSRVRELFAATTRRESGGSP